MSVTSTALPVADIDDVPDSFLAGQVEDANYYRATRHSLPGFDSGFLTVRVDGTKSTIVPYFTTKFNVGTMLDEGLLKQLVGWIGLRIACVGNPTTAIGQADGPLNEAVIAAVTQHLFTKAPIVCFKGFAQDLPATGFVKALGLPSAVMHCDNAKWSEVRSSRNIRRKLKKSAALRYEEHVGLPAKYADKMYELYSNTHDRAVTKFGKLTPDYFKLTSSMSVYSLVFLQTELVGFSQILRKGSSAVASFMGMDYSVAETHGLYFAIVIRIMDLAPELGLSEIEFGETSYTFKKQIGCDLTGTWIYYKHRNPMLNRLLAKLVWMLEPDESELK